MIRIHIEVRSEGSCFRATVCAISIERALALANAHYPEGDIRVMFPIEPESFFVRDGTTASERLLPPLEGSTRTSSRGEYSGSTV